MIVYGITKICLNMKFIFTLALFLTQINIYGQEGLKKYLSEHHYSFTLNEGFTPIATIKLKEKFSNYKVIIQSESGSHHMNLYYHLPLMWIKFFNKNFGLKHFFYEGGADIAFLENLYLHSQDTVHLIPRHARIFENFKKMNSLLDSKVFTFGIDFNSPRNYIMALKALQPSSVPPASIERNATLITEADTTTINCTRMVKLNKKLRAGLQHHEQDYKKYFGLLYPDFHRIINQKGTCKDVYRDRNSNLAANFLSFDAVVNDSIYFGELGMAHTLLNRKNTAAYKINESSKFKNKVAIINMYCHNCTSSVEATSNWALKGIEHDIMEYFLPLCSSNFTLFDLSEDTILINKYRAYGQFLMIVKNQD